MRGTIHTVNRAIHRPILIGGVEKSLFFGNSFALYLLIAASRMHVVPSLIALMGFLVMHAILRTVSKHDPFTAVIFRRAIRYLKRPYYPAVSHPCVVRDRVVHSVGPSC